MHGAYLFRKCTEPKAMSAKTIRLAVQGDRGTESGSETIESNVNVESFSAFGSIAWFSKWYVAHLKRCGTSLFRIALTRALQERDSPAGMIPTSKHA